MKSLLQIVVEVASPTRLGGQLVYAAKRKGNFRGTTGQVYGERGVRARAEMSMGKVCYDGINSNAEHASRASQKGYDVLQGITKKAQTLQHLINKRNQRR